MTIASQEEYADDMQSHAAPLSEITSNGRRVLHVCHEAQTSCEEHSFFPQAHMHHVDGTWQQDKNGLTISSLLKLSLVVLYGRDRLVLYVQQLRWRLVAMSLLLLFFFFFFFWRGPSNKGLQAKAQQQWLIYDHGPGPFTISPSPVQYVHMPPCRVPRSTTC